MDKPNKYDIEQIEQYLRGEMKGKELEDFEQTMKEDSALVNQVESIKTLPNNLFLLEKERLKAQTKKWIASEKELDLSDHKGKNQKNNRLYKYIGASAAAIAIVVMASLWMFNSNQNLNSRTESLIAQYHKGPVTLRASSDKDWEGAIQSYANRNFNQMINQMTPIIEKNGATTEQLFYFALAHLYTNPEQYDKALSYFNQAESQDASSYAEEIAWYRALIFIQKEEFGKAKTELQKIKSSSRYGVEAESLLEVLSE